MADLADIGVYGLGTMGSALALNLAESGRAVAVSNREADWIAPFLAEAEGLNGPVTGHDSLAGFVAALAPPRVILAMIPSGPPMDALIEALLPHLDRGDILIDGGNADFHDTRRRTAELAPRGLTYVGMGVSGGEEGARHGPSMMVGGSDDAWGRLRPMLEAIAARYEGDPCVAHVGPDGAGHFVKTVHNGIEYADMQLLAEVYGLFRDGEGCAPAAIGEIFARWNEGPLQSYLVEVTARVLGVADPDSGTPLIELISDVAGQKGTGRWTVIEAVRLGQSASIIDAAVAARAWSSEKSARIAGGRVLGDATGAVDLGAETLEKALLAARILAYAQGFRILGAAGEAYDWNLDHARIAEIWRAGCIIRSALLDDIASAFRSDLPEGQLILAPGFTERLQDGAAALRQVVCAAIGAGLPVPAMANALAFYDTMRQPRGTADLIQAQRDFFGHHGFERTDREGPQHGNWRDGDA